LSESQKEEFVQILNNIVTKCWQDDSFKDSLISDPVSICKEHGLILENFNNVEVGDREGSEGELILRIPPKPSTAQLEAIELPEEELEKQAGGITPVVWSVIYTINSVFSVVTIIKETTGGRTEDWRGDDLKGDPKKGGG